jgi:hypothetical protein
MSVFVLTDKWIPLGPFGEPNRWVDHDQKKDIRELLLGHRIAKIDDNTILLDDGTMVQIQPNVGGCGCGAGDYELADLNEVDNIITRVDFEYAPTGDGNYGEGYYRVFVLAQHKKLLWSVEGDDGNGYYGTGYQLAVRDWV